MRLSTPGRILRWLTFAVATLAIQTPATADWLVSRDGDRIETVGAWQVKRSLVLFTRPGGALASMRLSEIDIEASQRATTQAARSARKDLLQPIDWQVEPTPRPRRVIDHRSVKSAAEPNETDEVDTDKQPKPDADTRVSPIEVVFWKEISTPETDGIAISGTLRNTSPHLVTNVSVDVTVEVEGRPAEQARAFVDTTSLAARSTTTFRAVFPAVLGLVGEPQFEVRSRDLNLSHGTKTD